MISFNPEFLNYEEKLVKSISASGILTYIDEDGKHKKTKLGYFANSSFQQAVAINKNQKRVSFSSFFTPQKMLLIFYKDCFLAFEHNHIDSAIKFNTLWGSDVKINSEESLKRYKSYYCIKGMKENKEYFSDWVTDGDFFFQCNENRINEFKNSDNKEDFINVQGFKAQDITRGTLITKDQQNIISREGGAEQLLKDFQYRTMLDEYEKSGKIDNLDEKEKKEIEKKLKKINDLNFIFKIKSRSVHILKVKGQIAMSPASSYLLSKDKRHTVEEMSSHYYINIYFFKDLIRTIGGIYGIDSTRILNIKRILTEMNLISFSNVHVKTQKISPVNIDYGFVYFWILGFYCRENDLYKKKCILNLFSKIKSNELLKSTSSLVKFQGANFEKIKKEEKPKSMRKELEEFILINDTKQLI